MKTKFFTLLFLSGMVTGFAQKKELNTAKKAIKSGKLDNARTALDAAKELLNTTPDEKLAPFYNFLDGQVLAASSDKSLKNIEGTAMAFLKTIELEKASGSSKYTSEANNLLQKIRQDLVNDAIKDQNNKKYMDASGKLYLGYKTNKADTLYLYFAAGNAVNAKEYDTALKYYNELNDLNFTGIEEKFTAVNKENGKVEDFDTKQIRDISVKAKTHIKPGKRKTESRKAEIAKNVALIYITQGKDEEALKAMEAAVKENPDDVGLLQNQADMYYRLGNTDKYKEVMESIVSKDPENPNLFYNLGVTSAKVGDTEKALEYYNKAIELKSDFAAPKINIAALILGGEKKLNDQMNSLGTSSADNKKFDELKKKKQDLYRKAIPYLEGALKLDTKNIGAVRTLMQIYYQLDDSKADQMKAKLKTLEAEAAK